MSNGAEANGTRVSDSNKLGKTPPSLSYFCVYNPSLAQSEENTKDQILYYTAKKVVPADVKMKQVGLAQALVNFSSAFSPAKPAENVHSQKNRLVFYQPEPGFWMHMCIELGVLRKQTRDSKGKDKLVTEYLDSQLSDSILEAILKIGYEQFKLLNGTMTSMLQDEALPQRQRIRSLMHSIEEFFEDWIWKWDFDRLDANTFLTVFNGFPMQPLQRSNHQLICQLDERLRERLHIQHLLILNEEKDVVYHSSSLSASSICALWRWICDRGFELRRQRQQQQDQLTVGPTPTRSSERSKIPSLKSLTKSLSNTQIFSYFSTFKTAPPQNIETVASLAPTQTETTLPAPSEIPTAPSSPEPALQHGEFVTGLADDNVVRVYLSSDHADQLEEEYFLLVYQHDSGLVWTFLLPSFAIEEISDETDFLVNIEKYLLETEGLESATSSISADSLASQDKTLNLGKHYRYLYYDNRSRVIKSTLTDKATKENKATGFILTNDMFLQLLDLRNDFGSQSQTLEVYTRATSNYWVAGRRTFHRANTKAVDIAYDDVNDHQEPPAEDEDEDEESRRNKHSSDEDYVEVFLVAAKKDTSLAEVEDAVRKLATLVTDTTPS